MKDEIKVLQAPKKCDGCCGKKDLDIDKETLRELIKNGLNVCRLNFSHGSHEEHKGRMDLVKKLREELNMPTAILLDTKGPEIRTGKFDAPEVLLEEGQTFTITMKDVMGTKVSIASKSNGKGKIEIEYYNEDDLNNIVSMLLEDN